MNGPIARRNLIVGGSAAQYPSNNFYAASFADIHFENFALGRYRQRRDEFLRGASLDDTDPGISISTATGVLA